MDSDPLKKKPTEIIVLMESHSPSSSSFKKSFYEKADEIHVEYPPKQIEWIKRRLKTETPKNIAKEGKWGKEYTENELGLIKESLERGKIVIGTDIRPEESRKKLAESDKEQLYGSLRKSVEAMAESTEIRDKARLEETLERLKGSAGKTIVISAGAGHTPFYHALKKALKEEEEKGNVTIKRVFTSKGKVDADPRVLEKYPPYSQITRILRFKKGKLTPADEERIRELLKQHKKFDRKTESLIKKYQKNMTEEQAIEKANFELSTRLTREGLAAKTPMRFIGNALKSGLSRLTRWKK